MNEFRFDHLKNRRRLRLPRPVIYVGVAIILLAFFSIKYFQRAGEADTSTVEASAVVPEPAPDQSMASVPSLPEERPSVDTPLPAPASAEEESDGILSLDGEGERLLPPRRISGQRPVIPVSLLSGDNLVSPSIYVRVGKDGLVAGCKLISSSGSDEVDRLVLDALGDYTFHPAMTAGQPVEYSSVVTVPLRAEEDARPRP